MNFEKINSILKVLSIEKLTQFQSDYIKSYSPEQDAILLAPTGSGKTLAYLLPILTQIDFLSREEVKHLIIVPTRELAIQIQEVIQNTKSKIQSTVCYGGHSFTTEANRITEKPQIIIGTPGRLIDHLQKGTLNLKQVESIIFDEYDKCLEMGFKEQINSIYNLCNIESSKKLISATKLKDIPSSMI